MVFCTVFDCMLILLAGYGRNEQEATANCIKNVFEFLLEEESNITLIMQSLKKGRLQVSWI